MNFSLTQTIGEENVDPDIVQKSFHGILKISLTP